MRTGPDAAQWDMFASITASPVGGVTLRLPDALAGDFAVILLSRGAWGTTPMRERSRGGATGAFVSDEPTYLPSTGFVLGPDGRVIVGAYSGGGPLSRVRARCPGGDAQSPG